MLWLPRHGIVLFELHSPLVLVAHLLFSTASSAKIFSPTAGPFLTPLYGCGELPQAFCRSAAVAGAVQVRAVAVGGLNLRRRCSCAAAVQQLSSSCASQTICLLLQGCLIALTTLVQVLRCGIEGLSFDEHTFSCDGVELASGQVRSRAV